MNQATPAVACLRCRKQKLRCTREQPGCRRCQRANKQCSYPSPPDRKKFARERAREQVRPVRVDEAASSELIPHARGHPQTQPSHLGHAVSCDRRNVAAGLLRGPYLHRTERPSARQLVDEESLISNNSEGVQLADEVALFLTEIYFERHYQADLLFRKQNFIKDYLAQRLPDFISLAVFAFASLFLTRVPGGTIHGEIGITEISKADWCAIGERWAEQASKSALMNADKPCLPHVQACQILAMFWLAKSETRRTNMHTAIAYRTCRILQFNRLSPDRVDRCCAESDIKMRCFWACWLTKCASQQNARFPTDCWAEVVGCPLPDDSPMGSTPSLERFLDEAGSIQENVASEQNLRLGFNSTLVILHGLWWEVQHFVFSMQRNRDASCDPTSKIYLLDERLEDLHDRMDGSIRYDPSGVGAGNNPVASSRIFSLNYLYHLCLCYLHSAVVPMLSCGTQIPNLSRKTLQLAAEQAWRHSSIMVEMTEKFLMRKGATSKLWPIVGYGACVCAAIQLRCFLAFGDLSDQHLERAAVLLRVTGELKNYWKNLQPLHTHMERQFLQAQTLSSSQQECCDPGERNSQEFICLLTTQNISLPLSLAPSISTYVADEDRQNLSTLDAQPEASPVLSAGLIHYAQSAGHLEASFRPECNRPTDCPSVTESRSIEHDTTTTESIDTVRTAEEPAIIQVNSSWWDQDARALGDVFEQSFLVPELAFPMDLY